MIQLRQEELTILDIKLLAASIYEPLPRIWHRNQWLCPQCQEVNPRQASECRCGISRDGLPEFCER